MAVLFRMHNIVVKRIPPVRTPFASLTPAPPNAIWALVVSKLTPHTQLSSGPSPCPCPGVDRPYRASGLLQRAGSDVRRRGPPRPREEGRGPLDTSYRKAKTN